MIQMVRKHRKKQNEVGIIPVESQFRVVVQLKRKNYKDRKNIIMKR